MDANNRRSSGQKTRQQRGPSFVTHATDESREDCRWSRDPLANQAMAGTEERTKPRLQILVCDGPSCGVTYESELLKELIAGRLAADDDLKKRCVIVDYGCFGRCSEGPNMFIRELAKGEDAEREPDPDELETQRGFYPAMDSAKVERVVSEHCGRGLPIDAWLEDY